MTANPTPGVTGRAREPLEVKTELPQHPQRRQIGRPRHPQGPNDDDHKHPQAGAGHDPRHPQARGGEEQAAEGTEPEPGRAVGGTPSPQGRTRPGVRPECRREDHPVVPPPGALGPLARALLSVAAEVHATRRDPLGAGSPVSADHLRMPGKGIVHPARLGLRLGVRSPATPGQTPSGVASSHVKGTAPSPVVDSDCMGDCA